MEMEGRGIFCHRIATVCGQSTLEAPQFAQSRFGVRRTRTECESTYGHGPRHRHGIQTKEPFPRQDKVAEAHTHLETSVASLDASSNIRNFLRNSISLLVAVSVTGNSHEKFVELAINAGSNVFVAKWHRHRWWYIAAAGRFR